MLEIVSKDFGIVNGVENKLFTMSNGKTQVDIMNYGATIVAIRTLDKNGDTVDVVCGYDNVEDYINHGGYLGAIIGRNSNRISNAKFILNGKEYKVANNENKNNLHGGNVGFDKKMWDISAEEDGLVCKITSEDMEEGFPGKAEITVKYTLSDDNELGIEYTANCDKDTVMNLTNHTYFNLNGHNSGSIVNHTLKLYSDFYTPVDENCCPTGEVCKVDGTVFDFRSARVVGKDIDNVPDIDITSGYDHNFILNTKDKEIAIAAEAQGDKTGIKMEVYTNKPAIQFYAGNCMDECVAKDNANYKKRQGFCLETQFTPNCLTYNHLGDAILRAGQTYNYKTIYKFCLA